MPGNLLKVGVTGGIGSGKSTVCKMFMVLGIPVYDADSRAKILMAGDPVLIAAIKKAFGEEAYHRDGSVNRGHLSEKIFRDPEALQKMDRLVHPRVAGDFERWAARQKGVPYIIKEAALLFESGSYKMLDKVIAVTAPEPLRIRRVLLRDHHRTRNQVEEIIRNQMPERKKAEMADFVIINDEHHFLIDQVLKIHELLSA